MSKIPIDEALRLADAIELAWLENVDADKADIDMIQAELRRLYAENQALRQALEKLAKLGNGDRYGNSIGNSIAREALDKMAENARELGLSYEQPAQQEPYCYHDGRNIVDKQFANDSDVFPLYTTPPAPAQEPDPYELTIAYMSWLYEGKKRKPWVGLTGEDKDAFWRADEMTGEEWDKLFAEVEAKLREKNQ